MERKVLNNRAEARDYAIEWQKWVSEQNLSLSELNDWHAYWLAIAERFDLQEEFYENGII